MAKSKKHLSKKWWISIMELHNSKGKKYVVTRRLPELFIAETKTFRSKKKAKELFDMWLK